MLTACEAAKAALRLPLEPEPNELVQRMADAMRRDSCGTRSYLCCPQLCFCAMTTKKGRKKGNIRAINCLVFVLYRPL